MSETLQHLVLVRHGESEGDVRRSAWRRGEAVNNPKPPELEELTESGIEQSRLAGQWIAKNILKKYGLTDFDGCYVSSALRSEQSAAAMDIKSAVWQSDHCLDERNRGRVRGLRAAEHQRLFPDSFRLMKSDPLHWTPPGGNSILDVTGNAKQFLKNIEGQKVVIAMTHRDWLWAAQLPLDGLSKAELAAVNTDLIGNSCILHYTSINHLTGQPTGQLQWKRMIDPLNEDSEGAWQELKLN